LFIAYLGGREIKRQSKGSDAQVFAAINQARRAGKACPRIIDEEIGKLMAEPIADVRRRFNIGEPTAYQECLARFRAADFDPYGVMGQQAATVEAAPQPELMAA